MVEAIDYPSLSPQELNTEFRRLYHSLPVAAEDYLSGELPTPEELQVAREMRGSYNETPEQEINEIIQSAIWVDLARVEVVRRRHSKMPYTQLMIEKFNLLLPFVQGTESFNRFIIKTLTQYSASGIDKNETVLPYYLDDKDVQSGGIFDPIKVRDIENRAFLVYESELSFLRRGGIIPGAFDIPEEVLEPLKNRIEQWRQEFNGKYGEPPAQLDLRKYL